MQPRVWVSAMIWYIAGNRVAPKMDAPLYAISLPVVVSVERGTCKGRGLNPSPTLHFLGLDSNYGISIHSPVVSERGGKTWTPLFKASMQHIITRRILYWCRIFRNIWYTRRMVSGSFAATGDMLMSDDCGKSSPQGILPRRGSWTPSSHCTIEFRSGQLIRKTLLALVSLLAMMFVASSKAMVPSVSTQAVLVPAPAL